MVIASLRADEETAAMDLRFDLERVGLYTNASQKIRVLSEFWVRNHIYCPNCGREDIECYKNNAPVADFYCLYCNEQYELKSQRNTFGFKVVDGAYKTMLERLSGTNVLNLFLLNYSLESSSVLNFVLIPKQFFVPEIIEQRKPLSQCARRAGWIGCNIVIGSIPASGRIALIKDETVRPKTEVLAEWQHMLFLRDQKTKTAKAWLVDIMKCIEEINNINFSLDDVYEFESKLATKYPNNKHIRAKIRQQLQILRNNDYLTFNRRGRYRLISR